MRDLFRNEKTIDFSKFIDIDKKYYVVPLRLHSNKEDDNIEYVIDTKLLQKLENLQNNGYAKC